MMAHLLHSGFNLPMQGDKTKMRKGKAILLVYSITSIFFIFMDWLRFDLSLAVNSSGFDLFLGGVLLILVAAYIGLTVFSLYYFVRQRNAGLLRALIPVALMTTVFAYYAFVNYSNIYMKVDYAFNRRNREEIIEMYRNNELSQINVNRYLVPYRLASHNKKVYIQEKGGVIKAIFYISNGIAFDRVLLYSSDDVALVGDFGENSPYWELRDIRKIGSYWFFAELTK